VPFTKTGLVFGDLKSFKVLARTRAAWVSLGAEPPPPPPPVVGGQVGSGLLLLLSEPVPVSQPKKNNDTLNRAIIP
jgi:hypothetical protein